MIIEAISAVSGDPEKELVSLKKITHYIATKYSYNTDDKSFKNHVKIGLRSGVRQKRLAQIRASYKLQPGGRSRSTSPAPKRDKSTSPSPRKKREKKEGASPTPSPTPSPHQNLRNADLVKKIELPHQ